MIRNRLKNENGIALVTALMLTLITLTVILALMYQITQSTQVSGATKRYRSALDASYGGAQIVIKDVLPLILQNMSSTQLASTYSNVNLAVSVSDACFKAKLTLPTSQWPAGCSNSSQPSYSPDLNFTLQATSGNPYTVYSKIVDTVAGNTDTSGLSLDTHSVADSSPTLSPQHFPYVYRVEIQGERSTNPLEKSNLSILYAY